MKKIENVKRGTTAANRGKEKQKTFHFYFTQMISLKKENICFIILHIHADFFTLHTGIDSVVDSDVWGRSSHRYF